MGTKDTFFWSYLRTLSTFQIVAALVVIWLVYLVIENHLTFQIFKRHGIPGPKPVMFFGHILHYRAGGRMPHEVISQWMQEYGNVFGFFFGRQASLIINDANVMKEVMIRNFNDFTNRQTFSLPFEPVSESILMAMDDKWRDTRSLLTPAFSSGKLKLLAGAMNDLTDTLVSELSKVVDREINILEKMQALTLDVIAQCALALNVDCQRNERDPFLLSVREYFRYTLNPVLKAAIAFPFIGYPLVWINRYLTAGKLTDMIVNNLKKVIAIRRQNPNKNQVDILQLLLDAEDVDVGTKHANSTNNNSKKRNLTDREIIANAHLFLLAGYETTATTLGFVFYSLTVHPEIQEKLYEEIMENLADISRPSYDEAHALPYLDQVINETLRLYPVVPHFLLRTAAKDIRLGSVFIPKGVVVQAPVWQLHHDPELWPDPMTFSPERFAPENKGNVKTGSFFGYGIGPRNCIGSRFAQLEMKLAIIKILKNFKLVPSAGTEVPLQLACSSILLSAKNGVLIKLESRN